MDIQVKTTAAVMNLKLLARNLGRGPRAFVAAVSLVSCGLVNSSAAAARSLIKSLVPNPLIWLFSPFSEWSSSQGF